MHEVPSFPVDRMVAAVATLLTELSGREVAAPVEQPGTRLPRAVAGMAQGAGYLAEATEFLPGDLAALLRAGTPIVFVPWRSGRAHVLVRGKGDTTCALGERGERVTLSRRALRALLESAVNARAAARTQSLTRGIPGLAPTRALRDAIAQETADETALGMGFAFRKNTASTTGELRRDLDPAGYAGRLLGLSTAQSALATGAWGVIGVLALNGHADRGSLGAWALLGLTATLLQIVTARLVNRFTLRAASGLRQRLLEGALRIVPESLSAFGLGGLMVLAAQADSFLSSMVLMFVVALTTLTNVVAAALLLGAAPLPAFGVGIFAVALAIVALSTPRVLRLAGTMQAERLRLTTELVERMLGQRTRLVQQTPNSWHDGEDESLSGYAANAQASDVASVLLRALPRAYFLASLVVVFFVLVSHPSAEALALSLGGLTMGMAALEGVVSLQATGASLHALFRSIRPLLAESPATASASGTSPELPTRVQRGDAVVELCGVRYGYPGRARAVLDNVDFAIRAGDHVLIEGASGGGKTTLASLASVLRAPDAGLLLVNGVDQRTLGAGPGGAMAGERAVRSVIAAAPQFYKNHVFNGPLAFNLLLGRSWPPSEGDLADAREVMGALGLGPLLERMPGGLFQQVGETGWQLSHGERSRVFLARTLLQNAELVVLDETFGALDPQSLRQCMDVVRARTRTLAVITHR